MNNRLFSRLYLHLKNIFTLKESSAFATILMEKPGHWFAIAKMWEKYLQKKEILRKGPKSLFKISLWDSLQFTLVQINHLVSP